MNNRYTSYSDNELVKLIRGDDKKSSDAAFIELYDRYAIKVNAYCRSILNNREQAEDVFQETFIRFYQNADSNHIGGSVVGYLIKIARNLCLNQKRDRKNNISIDELDLPVNDSNAYEEKELSELLMMSLELLDNEMKDVLVMRVFNDLPYEEIASIMNITEARARYIVFKAKGKIKDILTPYFKDVPNNNS